MVLTGDDSDNKAGVGGRRIWATPFILHSDAICVGGSAAIACSVGCGDNNDKKTKVMWRRPAAWGRTLRLLLWRFPSF